MMSAVPCVVRAARTCGGLAPAPTPPAYSVCVVLGVSLIFSTIVYIHRIVLFWVEFFFDSCWTDSNELEDYDQVNEELAHARSLPHGSAFFFSFFLKGGGEGGGFLNLSL